MATSMSLLATIFIVTIALLHLYILVLEMFLWEKPAGLRAFGNTREKAALTRVMAANQGLYNGFLAAGLFWSLWLGDAGIPIIIFFLLCIAIAGIYGAYSAARKIIFIQTVPAVIALALLALT